MEPEGKISRVSVILSVNVQCEMYSASDVWEQTAETPPCFSAVFTVNVDLCVTDIWTHLKTL